MNGMELNVNYSILFLYTCGLAYYSVSFFLSIFFFLEESLIGGGSIKRGGRCN